jgi:UDP-N-acetylmuramate dehydrogenase
VGDYEIGYRSVKGPKGEWFLACTLSLAKGEGAEIRANIKKLLAKRYDTQPTNQPSCGSVFRNPEGDFSARLIEACGLKGFSIGGAQVSPKHANFIVNTGVATADDIERVIEHVKSEVNQKFGVDLIPEVRVIGVQQGVEE